MITDKQSQFGQEYIPEQSRSHIWKYVKSLHPESNGAPKLPHMQSLCRRTRFCSFLPIPRPSFGLEILTIQLRNIRKKGSRIRNSGALVLCFGLDRLPIIIRERDRKGGGRERNIWLKKQSQ